MNYYTQHTLLWLDGEFLRAAETGTDLYSQSLHYGYAVFEGIRSYRTVPGETRIFKPVAHFDRLLRSAQALNLPCVYGTEELIAATYALLEKNKLQDAYIRPIIYAPANMTFNPNEASRVAIGVWEMAPFLGEKLLRVMTSSFQRPNPKAFRIEAKAAGHYVNSILASQEAKANGYDEALLTDMYGFVAEGPGANVFFEAQGRLFTPATGNILPGITRATVLEICRELSIPVEERLFTIAEAKQAESAFFCGTAAEIIGWRSLDATVFTKPWETTLGRIVQTAYMDRVIEKHQQLAIV